MIEMETEREKPKAVQVSSSHTHQTFHSVYLSQFFTIYFMPFAILDSCHSLITQHAFQFPI